MNRERNPQIYELHQLVTDAIELALPAVISYEPAYYKREFSSLYHKNCRHEIV